MRPNPTLTESIQAAIEAREIHVALPGRVETYDASLQRASVKPLIKRGYLDEDGLTRLTESLPVIPDVPVVFPGAGGFRITFPLTAGDTVLLIISEASLDKWLRTGGEVDPLDDRRHHLTDAVAIPGLRDFAHTSPAHSTAVVIEADDLRLGAQDANDPVALKSDLAALKTAIQGAATTPGDGGAAFKTNILAALTSWPVSATKVKAK